MAPVECALVDSLLRPVTQAPVLSVIIPTYQRPTEMALAVRSIALQIDRELDGKVEIIVTDNASGDGETPEVLKQLAETFPTVNYMIHAENQGGPFQIAAAPYRARGRWTWVFGDDDALAGGGLKPIVALLEREAPAFLTINRQVWNKALDKLLNASHHELPDLRFDTFVELLELFGFDQLSFMTSQVYSSEAARAVEPTLYSTSPCRYSQMAYYVEAFHALPAAYMSTPVIQHRWDADAVHVHQANFHHLATYFPELLQMAAERAALGSDLFERIGGRRRLPGPEGRPRVTLVDNVMENLWRCIALGTVISDAEWDMLQGLSGEWRADRAGQLAVVREVYANVSLATGHHGALVSQYKQIAEGGPQSEAELEMLDQLANAVKSLEGNINEARTFAFEMTRQFN